ncbi:hypothetical protein BKA62DRAFT_780636, partial [Auriculariales sp. MPI-PUGE-AT-0066]
NPHTIRRRTCTLVQPRLRLPQRQRQQQNTCLVHPRSLDMRKQLISPPSPSRRQSTADPATSVTATLMISITGPMLTASVDSADLGSTLSPPPTRTMLPIGPYPMTRPYGIYTSRTAVPIAPMMPSAAAPAEQDITNSSGASGTCFAGYSTILFVALLLALFAM